MYVLIRMYVCMSACVGVAMSTRHLAELCQQHHTHPHIVQIMLFSFLVGLDWLALICEVTLCGAGLTEGLLLVLHASMFDRIGVGCMHACMYVCMHIHIESLVLHAWTRVPGDAIVQLHHYDFANNEYDSPFSLIGCMLTLMQ